MADGSTPALIALDFDGTLIEWGSGSPYVSPQTRDTLAEAIAGGIQVGLCSGRRWRDMRDILGRIGMPWGQPFPSFVVALEKLVYWVRDGELVEDGFADWNQTRAVETEALAQCCLRLGSSWFDALARAGLQYRLWHLWCDYGMEITFDTPEAGEQARLLLTDLTRDLPEVHVHRNYRAAYVVPASGTKGLALRRVAQSLGLPPERILGVGDSLNDLDMVDGRHGLSGATMANGDALVQAAVRAAGGYVASQPAEAGVGEIIRRVLDARSRSRER